MLFIPTALCLQFYDTALRFGDKYIALNGFDVGLFDKDEIQSRNLNVFLSYTQNYLKTESSFLCSYNDEFSVCQIPTRMLRIVPLSSVADGFVIKNGETNCLTVRPNGTFTFEKCHTGSNRKNQTFVGVHRDDFGKEEIEMNESEQEESENPDEESTETDSKEKEAPKLLHDPNESISTPIIRAA